MLTPMAIFVVNATFDFASGLLGLYPACRPDKHISHLFSAKDHLHMMPFVIVKPTASVVTNCSWSSLSAVPDHRVLD